MWHDRMSANFFSDLFIMKGSLRGEKASRLIFHAENKDPSSTTRNLITL